MRNLLSFVLTSFSSKVSVDLRLEMNVVSWTAVPHQYYYCVTFSFVLMNIDGFLFIGLLARI